MNYQDLTLNQRIAIKGFIQSEGKSMPVSHRFDNTDLLLLKSLWMLSDFKQAVNMFLNKYVNKDSAFY